MAKHKKTLRLVEEAHTMLAVHHPMTVRQIFYQLVSGQVTENSLSQYKAVSAALVDARLEGQIHWKTDCGDHGMLR